MSYTIIRRAEHLPEDRAITELHRAPDLAAVRRIGVEVCYRFLENAAPLSRLQAERTMSDVMHWNGLRELVVVIGPHRLTMTAA